MNKKTKKVLLEFIRKKILSFFILDVIENTKKAAADAAMVHPKHAASLKMEK